MRKSSEVTVPVAGPHRTQLYLDEGRYQYLACLARKRRASIAQVVREFIDEHRDVRARRKKDSFFNIIGMCSSGPKEGWHPDFARHIDDYLYGTWDGKSEPPKD
ncbi:MAG: hypothetical protein AAB368_14855 [bacterium]